MRQCKVEMAARPVMEAKASRRFVELRLSTDRADFAGADAALWRGL